MYTSFYGMLNMKKVPGAGIESGGIEQFPLGLGITSDIYIDPFVGCGKTFYSVMSAYRMESAVICDENPEVLNFYRQLKNHPDEAIGLYLKYEDGLDDRDYEERQSYIRSCLRRSDYSFSTSEENRLIKKAAIFCFAKNYHYLLENKVSAGVINIANGNISPKFYGEEPLRVLAKLLKKATILDGNFTECLNYVNSEAIIRIAPPVKNHDYPERISSFLAVAKGLGAQVIYH